MSNHNPFEGGRNADVADAMLKLRFENWKRLRKNLLARRRYKQNQKAKRTL